MGVLWHLTQLMCIKHLDLEKLFHSWWPCLWHLQVVNVLSLTSLRSGLTEWSLSSIHLALEDPMSNQGRNKMQAGHSIQSSALSVPTHELGSHRVLCPGIHHSCASEEVSQWQPLLVDPYHHAYPQSLSHKSCIGIHRPPCHTIPSACANFRSVKVKHQKDFSQFPRPARWQSIIAPTRNA
jgi:hypothetical protein